MYTILYHLTSIKWMFSAVFMLGTAPTYYAFWGSWRVVSSVLPSRVFEYGDECMYSLYQRLILFFFQSCSGVEVILYGDIDSLTDKQENVIFFSNHQCTVDWMVADMLAVQQGSLGRIRYVLKDGLKYMPLYGYYFRQHSCVYIKRSGKFSQEKAERQLDEFLHHNTPFWMVVFPEGTRYNPMLRGSLMESRNFAASKNWPLYNHVLTPRMKAMWLCVERLRQKADAVYDVTSAYSSTLVPPTLGLRTIAPSLADFLQGQCKQVHIHLKRIPISDVPSNSEQFEKWLLERFSEKDKLLQGFYSVDESQRGKLGPDGKTHQLGLRSTFPAFLFFLALNAPLYGTATGRSACWKLAIMGTVVSWAWVTIRN